MKRERKRQRKERDKITLKVLTTGEKNLVNRAKYRK